VLEVTLWNYPSERQPLCVCQVCTCPEYMPDATLQHAAWMGGAVLSKLVFQQNQQMTRYDYDEYGPAAIHRKMGS
jgi:actin-related protein